MAIWVVYPTRHTMTQPYVPGPVKARRSSMRLSSVQKPVSSLADWFLERDSHN